MIAFFTHNFYLRFDGKEYQELVFGVQKKKTTWDAGTPTIDLRSTNSLNKFLHENE
jgi:hypothetical protein